MWSSKRTSTVDAMKLIWFPEEKHSIRFSGVKEVFVILKLHAAEIQTNGGLNTKCQVIYTGTYGVTHYHPLILQWKNIVFVIKERTKCITIRGKENWSLWFRLKSSSLDHVSALAASSKACFLFGLFAGWILNHLGVVCKGCGAPATGWFSHLSSQRDMGNMTVFKRPTKI